MNVREAWDRVTAKRQEHQTAAGLQATGDETKADHQRAGMEWIEALCAEHGLSVHEVLETLLVAQADTTPNLRALVLVKALAANDLPKACFGGGFLSGLAVGLELIRERKAA
jgi:hypothetical protein